MNDASSTAPDGRSLPVGRRLTYAIARAEYAIRGRLDAELAPLGLTITGYSVLYLLAETPGMSGTELARRTLVTQQAVAHLLGKLERNGHVRRSAEGGRGRVVPFVLTGQGTRTLAVADERVLAVEHRLRADLDAAQHELLLVTAARCETLTAAAPRR